MRVQIDFTSENGKTTGVLAPNEFWYFWRRFIKYGEIDYLSDDELERTVDKTMMAAELAALTHAFEKPFALKGMILQQNIPFLHRLLDKAIFVQIKRDPVFNIQSVLRARERQLGDIAAWYSFKIKEYPLLKAFDPITQAAGQIYYIHQSIEDGLQQVEYNKKLIVQYEDFCQQPAQYYEQLIALLNQQGCCIDAPYRGVPQFTVSNRIDDEREFAAIQAAYQQFCAGARP